MGLYLRNVTEDDMDLLFEWANDQETRKNSFHSELISYETHRRWFERMLSDENILQYIMMEDDTPVGQIRLNMEGEAAEVSYSISSEHRGRGLGKKACALIVDEMKSREHHIKRLVARVKPENKNSMICFEKNGYEKSFVQFEYEI